MAGNQVTIRTTLDGAQQVGAGLKGIKAEATGLGSSFGGVGTAAEKGLAKVGPAVSHAKSQIVGLGKSIGPLLGVSGFLGLGAIIGSSIGKADEFGVTVSKMKGVLGLTAETTSSLVDTLDKFGITGDKQVTVLGRMEKNVAALAVTTKKADEFQKTYGFNLTDSNGKIADANVLLLRAADYYNSNATATNKATVLNKLYGKTWADMIPVLQLGSSGIKQEEAAAIHLTSTQLANMDKFKKAQRDFADTVGDLQVKIGAELMPTITGALKTVGSWLDAHSDDVVKFFHDAAEFGGQLAQGAKAAFGAIKTGWDLIPGPLKTLLIGGFAAGKVTKWLFGVDITASIEKALAGAVAGAIGKSVGSAVVAAGIGKAFVQPVFVTNPGFGGLGNIAGAGGAAVAGAEGAAAGAAGLGLGTIAVGVAAGTAVAALGIMGLGWLINATSSPESQAVTAQNITNQNRLKHGAGVTVDPANLLAARQVAMPTFGFGNSERAGMAALPKAVTALDKTAGTMSTLQKQLHADFRDAIGALHKASDPAAILAAAARVTKDMLGGVGNVGQTKGTIADLTAKRDTLLNAGEKAAAATITAEIRKLEALTPGRAHQAALLAQGAKIVASSESAKKKIADLTVIENQLKSLHRTTAAAAIQKQIDTITAINATTDAVGNIKVYTIKAGDTGKPTTATGGRKMTYEGKKLPSLTGASGLLGMTQGPTHMVVGEAGGEAVAIVRNPKPVQSSGAAGNLSISIDVHSTRGIITPGVARDIMRELGPLMTQWLQRNGLIARVGTPLRG